jgi:hypothetical protein
MLGWTAVGFSTFFCWGKGENCSIRTSCQVVDHSEKGRMYMIGRMSSGNRSIGGDMLQATSKISLTMVLVGILIAGGITAKPAYAEEEWRVGGMLQIPFGGSKEQSFVHFADTRIGVKVQYAEVDDIVRRKEQTVDRVYQDGEESTTVTSETVVTVEKGDKVTGGEAYLLIAPFNGFWDVSGGVNGFTGQSAIQGAAGLGYDPSFGGYLGIGALLPYSEAGVRLNFRYIDYFIGATSLPKFSSKTVYKDDNITYNDIQSIPSEESVTAETGFSASI